MVPSAQAVTPTSLKDIYTNLGGTLSRPNPTTNAAIVAACLNQGIKAIAVFCFQ
jgi:stage V sporulation protein SpoVS